MQSEERKGDWIQTYTGRKFWPLDPRPEDVDIRDIAHALSLTCRFCGHIREFYSVAQHSVMVMEHCPPQYRLWGLLHDAAEAYLSDLCAPVKRSLKAAGQMFYHDAEDRVMDAVCARFGLAPQMPPIVKEIDVRALYTEKVLFNIELKWMDGPAPLPCAIEPWMPERAEREFLTRFTELI